MPTRIAFNAGEFSPEMGVRTDVEHTFRALDKLENWEVSPIGGIRRRRGMRQFAPANSADDKLFPYIYSYAPSSRDRFVVLVSVDSVRVYDPETGLRVARFQDGDEDEDTLQILHWRCEPHAVRAYQVNSLLFLTSTATRPHVLTYDGSEWTFREWEFRNRVYRYNHEDREHPIMVSIHGNDAEVEFSADEDEDELPRDDFGEAEYLQASFYLEQQELESSGARLRAGMNVASVVPQSASIGQPFAVPLAAETKYYVCTNKDGWAVNNYVPGLESPANYASYFQAANDVDAAFIADAVEVYSVKDIKASGTVAFGTKVAYKSSYWDYWYCYKAFTKPAGGSTAFADYPEHFWHGLPVGDAGTCKGGWSFYCSGVWYGKYEVLRNYDTSEINSNWESRGTSFSRNFAPSNLMTTGDESDEECYLRLRLVQSRRQNDYNPDLSGAENVLKGFPADDCANRLIINSYKHDTVLKYTPAGTSYWSVIGSIRPAMTYTREVYDWSWEGFSRRYGYPQHATLLNSRLVFASTTAQPQTIWMSKSDDLNNFLTGDQEDSSLWLTLNTTSQNAICWLQEQNQKLYLGTAASENVVMSSISTQVLTNDNAAVTKVGYVGSSEVPALLASNNVLYVSRGAARVYQFAYSLEADGLVSTDLTAFSPHIGQEHGGFGASAMASKPDSVAYFVLGDGTLALCTYSSEQKVHGWHRWTTQGRILDVCVLPDGLKRDRVFLLVERGGRVCIEVVDDASEYEDNGGNDYVSLMVTNSLVNPLGEPVQKAPGKPFAMCFGEEVDLEHGVVEMSTDGGETWHVPARNRARLEAGWHRDLLAPSGWTLNRRLGLRVSGKRGMNILALQC